MKKKLIANSVIFLFSILLLFIPYTKAEYGFISLFNYANFSNLTYVEENMYHIIYTEIVRKSVLYAIIYFAVFIFFLISVIAKKQKYYKIFTSIGILLLVSFFIHETTYGGFLNGYIPSWSFYLSLLLLLGWVSYIFSPKWLPPLKKAFADFRSKHPSKAERIAELEREVEELKNQDESKEISSDIEKGSD